MFTHLGVVSPALADTAATSDPSHPKQQFTLVTVGPGSALFELWGHSALCVSHGEFEDGVCYDYGWSPVTDPGSLAIGTLRGDALFVPKKWPAATLLRAYQFRDLWTQELSLSESARATLLAKLKGDVAERRAYSYDPVLTNCTTRLRDGIDRELGGRIQASAQGLPGDPLRVFAEKALSGQVLPLALLELAGGERLDAPTSEWERMAFPLSLLESVKRHTGAEPKRIFSRRDRSPDTSRHAGRVVLLLLGLISGALLWRAGRDSLGVRNGAVRGLGLWMTFLSVIPILGVLSALPSLSGNWVLGILLPTDLLLLFGAHRLLPKYLMARVALTTGLLGLSLTGLTPQRLWVPCLLVLIPFGALLSRMKSAQPS